MNLTKQQITIITELRDLSLTPDEIHNILTKIDRIYTSKEKTQPTPEQKQAVDKLLKLKQMGEEVQKNLSTKESESQESQKSQEPQENQNKKRNRKEPQT